VTTRSTRKVEEPVFGLFRLPGYQFSPLWPTSALPASGASGSRPSPTSTPSPSLNFDAEVLVRKADAGAEYAITQFFFTKEAYLGLRDRVAARGRDIPIIPGLMPVTNVKQLARMTQLSGQPVPESVTSRLEAVADDPEAVRQVGVEITTELARQLLAEGAPGIHFITMNRSPATLQVWDNLGMTAAQ